MSATRSERARCVRSVAYLKYRRRRLTAREVRQLHASRRRREKQRQQAAIGRDIAVAEPIAKPKPKVQSERSLSWPLNRGHFWISSKFGPRRVGGVNGFHTGLDMAAIKGTPVRAVADATVVEAGSASGYGNTILLQHAGNMKTRYAHLHRIKVKVGQTIKRGHIIATVGNTGNVRANGHDGSHLHFEITINNQFKNPQEYLI